MLSHNITNTADIHLHSLNSIMWRGWHSKSIMIYERKIWFENWLSISDVITVEIKCSIHCHNPHFLIPLIPLPSPSLISSSPAAVPYNSIPTVLDSQWSTDYSYSSLKLWISLIYAFSPSSLKSILQTYHCDSAWAYLASCFMGGHQLFFENVPMPWDLLPHER